MDGCMYKCKLVIVFVVSQMYGWNDSVSLRYRKGVDGWMYV